MTQEKLFTVYARTLDAYQRCVSTGNDWQIKHHAFLLHLNDTCLPSGSGIDCGTKLDMDESKPDKLVFTFMYHHMNDNGMYCGWSGFKAIVTPSLMFGFSLRIVGKDKNGLKEYFHETFSACLSETVDAFPAVSTNP